MYTEVGQLKVNHNKVGLLVMYHLPIKFSVMFDPNTPDHFRKKGYIPIKTALYHDDTSQGLNKNEKSMTLGTKNSTPKNTEQRFP